MNSHTTEFQQYVLAYYFACYIAAQLVSPWGITPSSSPSPPSSIIPNPTPSHPISCQKSPARVYSVASSICAGDGNTVLSELQMQARRKHFKGGQAKSEQYYLDSHLHRPGSTLAIEKHGHADLKNLFRPWPGQPRRFRWAWDALELLSLHSLSTWQQEPEEKGQQGEERTGPQPQPKGLQNICRIPTRDYSPCH